MTTSSRSDDRPDSRLEPKLATRFMAARRRRCQFIVGILVFMSVTLALAPPAEAGRRPFIWVWDTEVLHERDVEVEQWIWEVNKARKRAGWLWWAPVFGVTDTLELAVPIEGVTSWSAKTGSDAGDPSNWQSSTKIARYGLELRWRLAENDPEESGPLVPLIRVAVKRLLGPKVLWQVEGNLVASYDLGDVHAALDLGGFQQLGASSNKSWLAYAGGLSYGVSEELRLGGEVFGEIGISKGWSTFTMVGPNIGLTHGRSWLTIGCLIGVTEQAANWMPRLLWAIKL